MYKSIFKLFFIAVCSVVMVSCGDQGKFLVAKGKVGSLTTETKILELDKLFAFGYCLTIRFAP